MTSIVTLTIHHDTDGWMGGIRVEGGTSPTPLVEIIGRKPSAYDLLLSAAPIVDRLVAGMEHHAASHPEEQTP